MRVVGIIQARMGSTRLQGKVLMDLCGDTVLARVVYRTHRAHLLDEVIVATTTKTDDDAIAAECERLNVRVFRGSELDLLDRYYEAAKSSNAAVVVRITSDCPLIDPELVDNVVRGYFENRVDYASNVLSRMYPRGLDTEVFSFPALEAARRDATESHEREHVTPFLYQHPERFKLYSVIAESDYSYHRWTLDVPEDLQFLRALFTRSRDTINLSWREILHILQQEPELISINQHVQQKVVPSR